MSDIEAEYGCRHTLAPPVVAPASECFANRYITRCLVWDS